LIAASLAVYAVALFFGTINTIKSEQLSTLQDFTMVTGFIVFLVSLVLYSSQEVILTERCDHREGFLFAFDKIILKSSFVLAEKTNNALFYKQSKLFRFNISVHFQNETAKISCPRFMKEKI
jgi:hypothetical protein